MNEYNFTSNAEEPQPNLRMVVDNTTNPSFVSPVNNIQPDLQVVVDNTKDIVLVADDAAVIRSIIKNTIQGTVAVIEASNGEEAIAKIKELMEQGQLEKLVGIFLDLRMPGSDGYVVLKTLKALNITVPVTVISGDDSMDTIQQVCSDTVDYISKPLSKIQILAACEKMARQKAMLSETSYQRTA